MSDFALRPAVAPARQSTPVDGATRAWRIATTPFRAWSDVPAPDLPAREGEAPANLGLAGEVFLKGIDGIRTRLWLRAMIQSAFRGAWLALLVACCWMVWSLATNGPALDLRLAGIAMGIGATLGLIVGILSKPSRARTAAMLDRTWRLHDRMATAVEGLGRAVPGAGERAAVPYLQMADGANTVEFVKRDPLLAVRPPVREIVLLVFWALMLGSLAFLRGVGGEPAALTEGFVPPFAAAAELPAEPDRPEAADTASTMTPEEVLERARTSNEARQDLSALAQALADHAVTRQAAEAIGQGDYERAADELRQLAPDAPKLSESARQDLADDLDQASSTMSDGDNGLKSASMESADGLRQGEKPAQEGMRSLAEAVETAGQQVAPQAELADQLREAQERNAQGAARQQEGDQRGREQASESLPAGQASESGQDSGEGERGSGARSSGDEGEQGDQQGEGQQGQGQAGQEGEANSGQGEGGQTGPNDRSQASESGSGRGQQEGDAPRSGQGGGAGSGDSGDREATRRPGTGSASGEDETKSGPGPEQRVTEGDGARRSTDGDAPQAADTIALPSGPGGEQGVQTSADGGSSQPGSGTGVTAGNGTATQGEVGDSGPDSNHVPAEYRDIVQNYFSGPEGR